MELELPSFQTNPNLAAIQQIAAWKPSEIYGWLVGQGHPSEKYEFVNWDD